MMVSFKLYNLFKWQTLVILLTRFAYFKYIFASVTGVGFFLISIYLNHNFFNLYLRIRLMKNGTSCAVFFYFFIYGTQ